MTEALVALRLLAAGLLVFVLPGFALLRLWDERPPLGERAPLAFGLSISLVTLLTVVWIEAGLGLSSMIPALLAVTLIGFARRRPAQPEPAADDEPGDRWLWGLGLAALAATAAVFYGIGGMLEAAPTGEEILHLSMIRKIWGRASLSPESLMYMPDTPTTYVYPPYHAMVALVARIAGVDPLVAFVRIRGLFTVIAVLTMAGLVQLATRRRSGGVAGLFVFLALLWWNVAGQVAIGGQPLYWARLAPLSHLGDFGLGIVLPLCVFFVLRYLQDERLFSRRLLMALAMASAAIVIHLREALQVLLYLGCFAAALFLGRERRKLGQTLVLIAAIVGVGLLYKQRHDALVGHIAMHEEANRQMVLEAVGKLLGQPLWGLFADVSYFREETLLFGAFPAVLLVAAPLALARSRDVALTFASASLVGFLLVFRIPALAWLYVRSTYSEVLMTPLRNVDVFCLLLAAVGVHAGVSQLPRLRRLGVSLWFAALWLTAVSVVVWAGLGRGLAALTGAWQDGFFAVFLACCLAALLLAARAPAAWRQPLDEPRWVGGWPALLLLAGPLLALGYASQPPTLRSQAVRALQRPRVERERAWYPVAGLGERLDYKMLQAVRQLPQDAVVMTEPSLALELTMLANVYVPTSGVGFSTDVTGFVDVLLRVRREGSDFGPDRWRAYQARSAYYHRVLKDDPPVFSPRYSAEQQLEFLALVRADYLLFRRDKSPHLQDLAESLPDRFELIRSVGPQRLYRFAAPGRGVRGPEGSGS